MHLDHYNYHRYTGPARLEKSINSLMVTAKEAPCLRNG